MKIKVRKNLDDDWDSNDEYKIAIRKSLYDGHTRIFIYDKSHKVKHLELIIDVMDKDEINNKIKYYGFLLGDTYEN